MLRRVDLFSLGLCEGCVGRYLKDGVSESAGTLDTHSSSAVCPICLGSLQFAHSDLGDSMGAVEGGPSALRQAFERSRYATDSLSICVQLPSAVMLREAALAQHLLDRWGYTRKADDLKDAVRNALRSVACVHGLRFDQNSSVVADVVYGHAESLAETDDLRPYSDTAAPAACSASRHSRKRQRRSHDTRPGEMSAAAVGRALARLQKGGKLVPEALLSPGSGRCPPGVPTTRCVAAVKLRRGPVLLAGSYNKYERGLSQTPWTIDGVRRGSSSVEELIALPLLPHFFGGVPAGAAREYKFHSAGREDIDVRMLGSGRPFVLELLDATRGTATEAELREMEAEANDAASGAVVVSGLHVAQKTEFDFLKDGAESKRKCYACVVWTSRPVSEAELTAKLVERVNGAGTSGLLVKQRTPVRVLHRRTMLTRDKYVHRCSVERLNARFFVLRLETSAGMYVKEFVHGDLGRTRPNVGELLGCKADILQLDVEGMVFANNTT